MATTVLLLGLLAVATGTDVRRHKIYNATTYSGSLAALALNAAGSMLLISTEAEPEALERWLGWIGVARCLLGFAACGLILLVCFVFFRVGGGDVKLMAMIGAFLGPERGIEAMLWTFVLGGCMGLIVLVWRVGPWRLVARAARQLLWTIRLGRGSPLSPDERAELEMPLFLAPSALAAVILVRFSLAELL